ncbi:MAG: AF1514 family protein [Candidatus Hydrogenedentota bacterium]|nr:MAG: AF1514 family protein [Candidatus Hydrogenedentota bacterium]
MRSIDLKLDPGIGYKTAEKAAREAVAKEAGEGLSLLAWYDKAKKTGAPQEACSLENWKCVRDYAEHRKADMRISINNDDFEFYFAKTPAGTDTLDKEGVEEVHKGIAVDRDENVQGG